MGTIITGVDGSANAASALAWAAREADLRGWGLTAAMSWGGFDSYRITDGRGQPSVAGEQAAAQALAGFVAEALGPEGAARVERVVTWGGAAADLIDRSREADLLVLGARGVGGFRALLLGSISQDCLGHAECPVAIIREDQWPAPDHPGPDRIVVGFDGSDPSRRALRWAFDEARLRSAQVDVVHAWQMPYAGGYPYTTLVFDPAPMVEGAKQFVASGIEEAGAEGVDRVEPIVVQSDPTSSLLEVAGGASMLVVGARGMGGFKSLLLGSVSHKLASHAPCPLVVVPAHG